MKYTFLTSSDSLYFKEHVTAFHKTVEQHHSDCKHIAIIINSDEESNKLADELKDKFPNFEYILKYISFPNNASSENIRTIYACSRFFFAKDIIEKNPNSGLLISDIDCYINKRFELNFLDEKTLGLFVRAPLA